MTKTLKAALVAGAVFLGIAACTAATKDTIDVPTQPVIVGTTPERPKEIVTGTYVVGRDIQPGTYQADSGEALCIWVRKSEIGGSATEGRIDSGIGKGQHIVTVLPTDKALYVSKCGTWTKVDI